MAIINVPEVLRKKLNEDGTDAFVGILNQVEQSAKENSIGIVSERFERRLSEEIAKVDQRISDETAKLDKRITDETAKLDKRITDETAKLDKRITDEMAKLRTEDLVKIEKSISGLDKRITDEMAGLKVLISDSHVSTVRWLFAFWTAQTAAVIGLFLHLK